MTDQLEYDLADVFGSTAANADVPHLPLDDVIARGRALQEVRRHRVALWTAVAAVAVVAVCLPVAVAAAHHGADRHPAPAHRTSTAAPTGGTTPSVSSAPPLVPYVQGGVLHLDGRSIGHGLSRAVASGKTVLVLRLAGAGPQANGAETTLVSLVEGGRLVPVPALTSVGLSNHESSFAPYLSADGTVAVAMSWRNGTTMRMTAWSVPDRRVLGTVDLRDTVIAPEGIAGIERGGTVIYFDPDAQYGYAWLPGHAPRRLDAATSAATERGSVVVGDTGLRVVTGISDDLAGLSPDGSAALRLGTDGTASVLDLHTGRAVTLDLPQHVYEPVGFESTHAVLVTVGDEDGGPLFRCDTASGACGQVWSDTRGIALPRLRGGW